MTATIKYSDKEKKVLGLLPRDGSKITSARVRELFYGRAARPFHSRVIVTGILNSLMRKVSHNKEAFRVVKGKRNGPNPMEFWLEKPQRKAKNGDDRPGAGA